MATLSNDKVGESQPQAKCFPPLFQLVYLSANHITIGVKTQTLKLVVYGKAFHKKKTTFWLPLMSSGMSAVVHAAMAYTWAS